MNIISINYSNELKEMIISKFSDKLKEELSKIRNNSTVFNYKKMLSSLNKSLCNITKKA